MKRPLDDTPALESLRQEVRQLERRVRVLEDRALQPASEPLAPVWYPVAGAGPGLFSGLIQVFGRAVLGIGGAYLLRAAAESGASHFSQNANRVPWLVGAAAALIYAAVWLYSAARTRRDSEAAGIVYAATAALIVSPMLWETTVRFKVFPPPATAGLLLAFAAAAGAVAWFRDRPGVTWAALLPAAATAMVLLVATGDAVPFVVALLMACAMVESAASRNRWLRMRPWLALLADIAIWLALRIAAQPGLGAYRAVSRLEAAGLGLALLAIYALSVGLRTIRLRKSITIFEIAQLAASYVLAVTGAIWLTGSTGLVGVFCLVIATGSYFVAFRRFSIAISPPAGAISPPAWADSERNQTVYALQGLGLLLTGISLLFPGTVTPVFWGAIALAASALSRQKAFPTLAVHAAISLAASALTSGLFNFGRWALAEATPPATVGVSWIVSIAAVGAYLACPTRPLAKWPRLAIASMAGFGSAALLVTVLARACGPLTAGWLAALRTLVGSSITLLMGFAGSRWKRPELILIGYAMAALLTLKLFWEDFPQGSPGTLAVSLVFYGAILLFGPRLIRGEPK